ncbi:MAG TPA: apolipoprotein N-acyltransferase [Sandaracinaceae bacterium LLY-WYZ-13_1]|nr:apolipoprotein N-acyltransferase [Sandaracinaceae bacterium LLY-WYZ-13_1]
MRALRSAWLAVLTGALIAAAGAPLEMSFLALLAPAALLLALEPRPGEPVPARRALWIGLLAGTSTNLLTMYWIVGLLMRFGHFPLAAALPVGALLWMGQSGTWVVGSLIAVELMRRRMPGWLALPACLTVAATLAPALFPWRYGVSQLPFLPYAQVAELGGLPLLDWLVATVGCAGLDAVRRRRGGPAVAAGLALLLPTAWGLVRLPQVRAARAAAPALAVGVTQPNVSIEDKHDPQRFLPQLRLLREMTRALEARGAELVLWPESAYRYPLHRDARRDHDGALGAVADGVHGPLLVGVLTTDGARATSFARDEHGRLAGSFRYGRGRRFNSAVALGRDGRVLGIADKVQLLAFGEYTPLWEQLEWLQRFPRGLTPGRGPQVVRVAGARVGVLNCYEDLLAGHVLAQSAGRPDFWANLTNNAWFGDTSAPHLHHMNARMRAIETRRDVVRAVNTGVSGHTAATGEDLARTGTFERAAFVADVRLLDGATPWARLGDWVTPLIAGAMMGFVVARRRRRGERARGR